MGHSLQSCLVDQLARLPADPIGLVLDPHEGLFQLIDEIKLPTGHLAEVFALIARTSIFHGHITVVRLITAHLICPGDVTM